MRIDAHVHFWERPYAWMTGELAALRRPFGSEHLRPALAAAGVERVVVVQADSSLVETRSLLALAAATDLVAGVVGWVDLADPDVAAVLADLRAGPGGEFLVGVRHQVHDEPDAEWLLRGDVRRGLRAVGEAGLVYDLLVRPRELPAALATARAFPELPLVIDHLAKPPVASGELETWAARLAPFAELGHVACKLSGLVTEADWVHWQPDDLRPYLDRALEWFGEERLLFGSDWPVCTLAAATYVDVVNAYEEALGDLTPEHRRKVFGSNAAAWYRLPISSGRAGD